MFRKLYWVTEQLMPDGRSRVTGVFTSIPNLVREGLAINAIATLRITLTKLDCESGVLGRWVGPDFNGLEDKLSEFIATEEFSPDQCESLVSALGSHSVSA